MPESTTGGASFDGEASSGKNSLVPSATGIRRAAMDWLARREYARCELEQKLHRRFPDATAAIGPVLDQLEHEGLLSDARFLESFIRSRVRRGHGPIRIAVDLRQRGIGVTGHANQGDDGGVDATGHSVGDETGHRTGTRADPDTGDDIDWLAQAREVRARRFGSALPAGPAERNRQMAFLQRRGFPVGICRQACSAARDGA